MVAPQNQSCTNRAGRAPLAVMIRAGAAVGPVVAFLTGWSVLALHRTVAWEIPILGIRFALLRWGVSLLLPVLAGALASLFASSLARD